jgi:acyl dehydratase
MFRSTKILLKYKIGQSASTTKTFTKNDVLQFAQLTGDTNSIHIKPNNEGNVIVHGCLLLGMFSAIGGTILPGDGAFLVKVSDLKIVNPVFSDQKVVAELKITRNMKNKFLETIGVIKCGESGKVLLEGVLMLKV